MCASIVCRARMVIMRVSTSPGVIPRNMHLVNEGIGMRDIVRWIRYIGCV